MKQERQKKVADRERNKERGRTKMNDDASGEQQKRIKKDMKK